MADTDRAKLRKDNPDTWIAAQAGDYIHGTITDLTAAWSDAQYDDKDPESGFYPLLRVAADDAPGYESGKNLAVHAFARVLQARILEHEPAPGEVIKITYEGVGEQKTKGRSAPELYTLEIEGRDPAQVAARVYGQLRGKRKRLHVPGAPDTGPDPDPDVPIDTDGL